MEWQSRGRYVFHPVCSLNHKKRAEAEEEDCGAAHINSKDKPIPMASNENQLQSQPATLVLLGLKDENVNEDIVLWP
jgi:hypothetical protein